MLGDCSKSFFCPIAARLFYEVQLMLNFSEESQGEFTQFLKFSPGASSLVPPSLWWNQSPPLQYDLCLSLWSVNLGGPIMRRNRR